MTRMMKIRAVVSCLALLAASAPLTGCGLAETGAAAATEGAAAAEQAKQGKELEAKVQRDVAASQKATADQLAAAEAASQ